MDTHKRGNAGEELAVRFLAENGYDVIARNYRLKDAEIDIVFKDVKNVGYGVDEYIVFAEVKYRSSDLYGYGSEAVNSLKIKKIIRAARHFLYTFNYPDDTAVRFDVISICNGSIDHIMNAFTHQS